MVPLSKHRRVCSIRVVTFQAGGDGRRDISLNIYPISQLIIQFNHYELQSFDTLHIQNSSSSLPEHETSQSTKMKTTSAIFALAFALPAFAAPPPAATSSAASSVPTFGGVAIRSGSEIQYASVNANGTYFWLHRGSETYTPSSVDQTNQQNNTLFVGGNGGLSLLASVPGGQEVYVDSKSLLRFTAPHSANTGTDSKTTGFSITDGHLQFEGNDFLACNLGEAYGNAYEIYAASGSNTGDACEDFAFRLVDSTGPAAWEYA